MRWLKTAVEQKGEIKSAVKLSYTNVVKKPWSMRGLDDRDKEIVIRNLVAKEVQKRNLIMDTDESEKLVSALMKEIKNPFSENAIVPWFKPSIQEK